MKTIRRLLKEKKEKKTSPVCITLSNKILKKLKGELKRLKITNRSFLVEMILLNYFMIPLEEEDLELKEVDGDEPHTTNPTQ